MNKLLLALTLVFAVSNAFAKEGVLYNEPYVPIIEIPNLDSMPTGSALINPNKILYMTDYDGDNTNLHFMSAMNKPSSFVIKGLREDVLQEFSKNKCHEQKPECTNKDSKYINLYKTPIFISIAGVEGTYNGTLSININNIEYIAYNSTSNITKITLAPYTVIQTKLSLDKLRTIIYGATH